MPPYRDIAAAPKDCYNMVFESDAVSADVVNSTALVDAASGFSLTYGEFLRKVQHLSTGISSVFGLKKGDTILLFSFNSIYFPVVAWAGLRLGCAISPSNPLYQVHELAHQLRDSRATVLFCSQQGFEVAKAAATEVGLSHRRIVLLQEDDQDAPEGFLSQHDLIHEGSTLPLVPAASYSEHDIVKGHPAFLCYSSGTTGLPKGLLRRV
ncbi:hypothetical protein HDU91_000302 [Kappamyces sp. JEL0680]|nr:hypothetical protein HDU91_000302 [Kappamyces sp. JEL0680]